jgi:ubiquinone/menaquinone biosynthesis C-methylase UbiE
VPFYRERIYPEIVRRFGNSPATQAVRARIIPMAEGRVLEIGVGPGPNFRYYDRAKVRKLYALEPNPGMRRRAEPERARSGLDVEFLDLPGGRIPLPDASVDTVVSTFTLCTIPGVVEAIRGLRRVLAPAGRFLFFEHGLSPDPDVRKWQRRTEPLTRFLFEGCHVTRDIPVVIERAGFHIATREAAYLEAPKAWTYCHWGTAVPL